jgi:alpha-ketoglutarate-dependent taurine dioxygenase
MGSYRRDASVSISVRVLRLVSIAVPLVTDPAAWTATSFASAADYTLTLTDTQRQEIVAALHNIERAGRLCSPTKLTASDFPLQELGPRLEQAFEQVRSGCGFVVIKGLPRTSLNFEQFAAAVWGLNTFFGFPISQNAQGELLSEVIDASAIEATPRMYRSALELGLHTDVTGMLSLACWNPARRGGETVLASGVTIHNEIARRAPHLLEVLYRGFHYHRLGEQGPHQEPVTPFRIPVFAVRNGQVSVRSARAGFIAGHHELRIPFSDKELEAIDLFDQIAREPGNLITFPLEAGDLVIINNYVVMHARKAFEDYDEPARKRRLLRIWLDEKSLRSVPAEFNQMGAQNGIPYQQGRTCSYDFQRLFREVDARLLGAGRRNQSSART